MFYLDTLWFVQARAVSTDGLRPGFFTINAVVYVVQVYIYIYFHAIFKIFVNFEKSYNFVFVGSGHGDCIAFRLLFGWFCGGSLFELWLSYQRCSLLVN